MPLDLHDALHPIEGPAPEQPPLVLGAASSNDDATEGSPPFVMRRLSLAEWGSYIAAYVFTWRLPSRLVLHHTWRPTQDTWNGYTSMRGMQRYYAGLGWTSAPHIYCAPDGIWLATPLSLIGIHAGRGNGSVAQGWYSIGIEMVGDFDRAVPSGAVWERTRAVLGGLQARVGRPLASVLSFHRDWTNAKSCPGHMVTRPWVLEQFVDACVRKVRVTSGELNIRQGPGANYPIVARLRYGDVVEVDSEKSEGHGVWWHMRNEQGFIHSAYTEEVI